MDMTEISNGWNTKYKLQKKKVLIFYTEFLPTNFFNVVPKLKTRFLAEAIYDIF